MLVGPLQNSEKALMANRYYHVAGGGAFKRVVWHHLNSEIVFVTIVKSMHNMWKVQEGHSYATGLKNRGAANSCHRNSSQT